MSPLQEIKQQYQKEPARPITWEEAEKDYIHESRLEEECRKFSLNPEKAEEVWKKWHLNFYHTLPILVSGGKPIEYPDWIRKDEIGFIKEYAARELVNLFGLGEETYFYLGVERETEEILLAQMFHMFTQAREKVSELYTTLKKTTNVCSIAHLKERNAPRPDIEDQKRYNTLLLLEFYDAIIEDIYEIARKKKKSNITYKEFIKEQGKKLREHKVPPKIKIVELISEEPSEEELAEEFEEPVKKLRKPTKKLEELADQAESRKRVSDLNWLINQLIDQT